MRTTTGDAFRRERRPGTVYLSTSHYHQPHPRYGRVTRLPRRTPGYTGATLRRRAYICAWTLPRKRVAAVHDKVEYLLVSLDDTLKAPQILIDNGAGVKNGTAPSHTASCGGTQRRRRTAAQPSSRSGFTARPISMPASLLEGRHSTMSCKGKEPVHCASAPLSPMKKRLPATLAQVPWRPRFHRPTPRG